MAMQVNLLPTRYRPQPQVRLWPIILTVVLSLNLIITGTFWLTLHLDLGETRSKLQGVNNEIASMQRRIDESQWKADLKDAVERKTKFISDQISGSVLWSPALSVIESSLIPGVVVSSVGFSGDGAISLTAAVDSIEIALNFWASLQTATGLDGIWLYSVPAEGEVSFSFSGWYGREVSANEE